MEDAGKGKEERQNWGKRNDRDNNPELLVPHSPSDSSDLLSPTQSQNPHLPALGYALEWLPHKDVSKATALAQPQRVE